MANCPYCHEGTQMSADGRFHLIRKDSGKGKRRIKCKNPQPPREKGGDYKKWGEIIMRKRP